MADVLKRNKLKVLHTADWHVCNEFMEDAERCLDFMANHVEGLADPVDLIVISGDIYNHRQIRQESEAARLAFQTVKRLSECAPVIVLTGTPSHDGYAPLILRDIGPMVKVMDKPGQLSITTNNGYLTEILDPATMPDDYPVPLDVLISCTPAFTKQYFHSDKDVETSNKEIADAMAAIFAGFGSQKAIINRKNRNNHKHQAIPHILLGHYQVGGSFIHPSQPLIGIDIEVAQDHLALAGADVNCLGHIHAAQEVNPNTIYCGSLFATDFGEYEDKGFFIHTLECVDMGHHWEKTTSEFVLTPSPKLVKLNVDLILNPVEDDSLLLQSIMMVADKTPALDVEEGQGSHIVCRMEVKVYQDEANKIDQEAIVEYFEEAGLRSFDLSLNRIPRPNVRSKSILDADMLKTKVELRAKIVNNPVTPEILHKAELLQHLEADELINNLTVQIRKEKDINEAE